MTLLNHSFPKNQKLPKNIYFQKSYEPKRETSKSKKCEILEDSLHGVTLSAPEKKDTKWAIKKKRCYMVIHNVENRD